MRNALPVGQDLQNLWASTKVIDPTSATFEGVDWDGSVSNNVVQIQTQTGRRLVPIWTTRFFDPPIGTTARLPFKADLCSAQNVVGTSQGMLGQSIAPTGNVVYANGRTLTVTLQGTGIVVNSDFYWGPDNAEFEGPDGEGRPWTWLDFQNFFPSPLQVYLRKSIAITGYWGYIAPNAASSPQIPDDLWHAILHLSAIETIPMIELAVSRSREQVQTQVMRSKFNAMKPQLDIWKSLAMSAITNHKKVEYF